MKKSNLLRVTIVGLVLTFGGYAHASLVGAQITLDNSSTYVFESNTTDPDTASVSFTDDFEFKGVDSVSGSFDYTVKFNFADDINGNEIFVIGVETNDSDFTGLIPDFSVTINDISWQSDPSKILTGLQFVADEPGTSPTEQGLMPTVTADSITLKFEDFQIFTEFREITYLLQTGTDAPVVPVPPAAGLALLGMAGVAVRRWFA